MSEDAKNNLKLIGKNQEDLKVISAHSQDSIVAVKDMIFLEKNRIFLMMVNRFMWEDLEKGIFRGSKRIRSVVKFTGILKVLSTKINQNKKKKALEFLAMKTILNSRRIYEITLIFSGDSMITIFAEEIDVLLDDRGIPWNVKIVPRHII